MNATQIARARTERQRRHRAKTGGLVPREHKSHSYERTDSRRNALKESDALLASVAKATAEEDDLYIDNLCPRCGAVGDEPCRKPNGRKADTTHKDRMS